MDWWEPAQPNASADDVLALRQANPGYGDIVDPADFVAARTTTPENEYRIKRLNQWVVGVQSWLPDGAWDACRDLERRVSPSERVVLAFDGSWTNDSTGISGCTVEGRHHFVVELWEPAVTGAPVDSQQVEDRLEQAMTELNVVAIAADPSLWREQVARWTERGWPVVEWPNTLPRMVPAVRGHQERQPRAAHRETDPRAEDRPRGVRRDGRRRGPPLARADRAHHRSHRHRLSTHLTGGFMRRRIPAAALPPLL